MELGEELSIDRDIRNRVGLLMARRMESRSQSTHSQCLHQDLFLSLAYCQTCLNLAENASARYLIRVKLSKTAFVIDCGCCCSAK